MSNDITIRLKDNRARVAEKMQLVQDVASGIQLIPSGLARVHATDHIEAFFAVLELVAVGVLGVMTVREMRDHDDVTAGINWVNIVVGAMLLIENTLRVREGTKWFSPLFLTGVASIFVGLAQSRIRGGRGRRFIHITDDRLNVRLGKFRQFNYDWSEIESIREDDDEFVVTPRSGKARTIKLRRYSNRDELREGLRIAATRAPGP